MEHDCQLDMNLLRIHLLDEDRAAIAAGQWTNRITSLENARTPGWRPGWAVQVRLRDGILETVASPSRRQPVVRCGSSNFKDAERAMEPAEWLDQLNVIDPFYGDEAKLILLVMHAPTLEDRRWLVSQIAENRRFRESLFSAGELPLLNF